MKKLQYLIAAGALCGATMLTACSDDNSSNASNSNRHMTKKQSAFVKNTRKNMKNLAENLNFSSWNAANTLNKHFNDMVLANKEFDKGVSTLFSQQIQKTLKDVDEDSDLAEYGFNQYATIDLTEFNYKFTVNKDKTGFDVKEADDFQIIIPGVNPETNKEQSELFRLTLKADGKATKTLNKKGNQKEIGFVVIVPQTISFTIEDKISGKWQTAFSGDFNHEYKILDNSNYASLKTDKFNFSGTIKADLEGRDEKLIADNAELNFALGQDPSKHKANMEFSFVHNGKNIVELSSAYKNENGLTDLTQLTLSNSILDLLEAIVAGNSVEEQKITLLDDMTITTKVSDSEKMLKLHRESKDARRKYADEETIQDYAEQMNDLLTISIESKATKQDIQVKLEAEKFGVDFMTMPYFKFEDSKDYVSLLEILDQESMEYAINILDHAISPMSDAIVVARQLLQYVKGIMSTIEDNQESLVELINNK